MRPSRLGKRKRKRREDFGLRWQPAEAKRSEDWSAAATPLFDCGQSFQSGVALRFPPQSKKIWRRRWFSAEEPPGQAQLAASAIHFANENAAFPPVSSPVSGTRSIGRVIIANPWKKIHLSSVKHLTEKN
jgi:hypothetical protein